MQYTLNNLAIMLYYLPNIRLQILNIVDYKKLMSLKLNISKVLNQQNFEVFTGEGYLTIPSKYYNYLAIGFLGKSFCKIGRYNSKNKQTIYLGNTINILHQEIAKYCSQPELLDQVIDSKKSLQFLYKLHRVLDLTQCSIQTKLGITQEQLITPSDQNQELGDIFRSFGLEGIKVPSDYYSSAYYIVIFRDRLLPESSVKTLFSTSTIQDKEYEWNLNKCEN